MSDIAVTIILGLACLAILIVFHLIWRKEFLELKKMAGIFMWIYVASTGAFILFAIGAIVFANNPNYDYLRKFEIGATVISCIWYAAWCSQYKMDKADGIARKN